jgi:hypothetical protein
MFINLIHFPPLKAGKDTEFRAWFAWSNSEYAKHPGFISRPGPPRGRQLCAIAEHESYETFMTMHTSLTQALANQRVTPLLEGRPTPEFFDTVTEWAEQPCGRTP